MATPGLTDGRLLFLLRSGELLMNIIDPEGLLQNGSPRDLLFSMPASDGSFDWTLSVSFDSGNVLIVKGKYSGTYLVKSVLYSAGKQGVNNVGGKPSSTLLLCLGNLSALPSALKKDLSAMLRTAVTDARSYESYDKTLCAVVTDALFYDVIGGAASEGHREGFKSFRISFANSAEGVAVQASISGKAQISNASVVVVVTADLYGLSRKSVSLERNLSATEHFSAECVSQVAGRNKPSLDVAFKLNTLLDLKTPVKQIVSKKSIGKPKMKHN